MAKDYEDVTYEHMLVDNCPMQLENDPKQYDVILTENMFGDILSDEASMITGSIGMLSSASLAEGKFGLYEPSHGSAPDIAGQDIANPIATILSAAMMLRYSFDLDQEADAIEKAVKAACRWKRTWIICQRMKQIGCKRWDSGSSRESIKFEAIIRLCLSQKKEEVTFFCRLTEIKN